MPQPLPIYSRYIQKSYTFLFPLLELARHPAPPRRRSQTPERLYLPENCYLRLKGLWREEDHKLLVLYPNDPSDDTWLAYQQKYLVCHPLLDTSTETLDGHQLLYVFDLAHFADDLRKFLRGDYAGLSPVVKQRICDHYGVTSPEWAHVEGFLHPEKHFRRYAELLGVPESDLRQNGQLCPPFDPLYETLSVELPENFVELTHFV